MVNGEWRIWRGFLENPIIFFSHNLHFLPINLFLNEFSGLKLNCLKCRSDQCFAQSSIAIMKIFQGVCWSKVSRHSLQKAKHLPFLQFSQTTKLV